MGKALSPDVYVVSSKSRGFQSSMSTPDQRQTFRCLSYDVPLSLSSGKLDCCFFRRRNLASPPMSLHVSSSSRPGRDRCHLLPDFYRTESRGLQCDEKLMRPTVRPKRGESTPLLASAGLDEAKPWRLKCHQCTHEETHAPPTPQPLLGYLKKCRESNFLLVRPDKFFSLLQRHLLL